jgi:hypothetical protein
VIHDGIIAVVIVFPSVSMLVLLLDVVVPCNGGVDGVTEEDDDGVEFVELPETMVVAVGTAVVVAAAMCLAPICCHELAMLGINKLELSIGVGTPASPTIKSFHIYTLT